MANDRDPTLISVSEKRNLLAQQGKYEQLNNATGRQNWISGRSGIQGLVPGFSLYPFAQYVDVILVAG